MDPLPQATVRVWYAQTSRRGLVKYNTGFVLHIYRAASGHSNLSIFSNLRLTPPNSRRSRNLRFVQAAHPATLRSCIAQARRYNQTSQRVLGTYIAQAGFPNVLTWVLSILKETDCTVRMVVVWLWKSVLLHCCR